MAVGTVVKTWLVNPDNKPTHVINRLELAWTSDGSGNVTYDTTKVVNGIILRVVTNPGSAAPTDDWDVTLSDADGLDVLAGQGANRDTANSEHFTPGVALKDGTTTSVAPISVVSIPSLSVSGAGSAKTGSIIVYYR